MNLYFKNRTVELHALYHFLVEHDGITTDPFGQKVKFKFASKTEIDINNLSYEKDSPMNALIQEIVMSSCQCFPDTLEGNIYIYIYMYVLSNHERTSNANPVHAWYMPYACIGGVCLLIHACMHGVYKAKRYVHGDPPKF